MTCSVETRMRTFFCEVPSFVLLVRLSFPFLFLHSARSARRHGKQRATPNYIFTLPFPPSLPPSLFHPKTHNTDRNRKTHRDTHTRGAFLCVCASANPFPFFLLDPYLSLSLEPLSLLLVFLLLLLLLLQPQKQRDTGKRFPFLRLSSGRVND